MYLIARCVDNFENLDLFLSSSLNTVVLIYGAVFENVTVCLETTHKQQ